MTEALNPALQLWREQVISSWGQFVAMLFCQLAQAKSLPEITEGLQASEGKLKRLGLPEAQLRSTLAYRWPS